LYNIVGRPNEFVYGERGYGSVYEVSLSITLMDKCLFGDLSDITFQYHFVLHFFFQ
ncbi:hypothetical protein ACJX0J_009428, partial [Zea mays]